MMVSWRTLADRSRRTLLFGRDAALVPPTEMMFDGGASYREFRDNGAEFLRHYVDWCALGPDDSMLDIGSGIGRKTLPLVHYLHRTGRYVGLDPVRTAVDWCTQRYTRRYPNFTFQWIDVRNDLYNPQGSIPASEFSFPFGDREFDLVVLNSVFTHMVPGDVDNYLREIARVLKPGGRCLVSWFLLNDESRELIAQGKSTLDLLHPVGPARALSADRAEDAIGYDEAHVRDLYARAGLDTRLTIRYGSWCGRPATPIYQDQIVATR